MKTLIKRLAIIDIECHLPETFAPITIDDIIVEPTDGMRAGTNSSTTYLHLSATRPHLEQYETVGDEVILPVELVSPLQAGIELYANLLAIEFRCNRTILSPEAYVAIVPVDDEAKEWASNYRRIKRPLSQWPSRVWPNIDMHKHFDLLEDRLDGVELLAEALCHKHPTGRLHDLIRVFERAFRTGPTAVCSRLLPEFLSGSDFGFSVSETNGWLSVRDLSVHADRRSEYATQADTQRIVNRVEQAAYDVLFNKDCWRNPSTKRRDVYHPWFAANDAGGECSVLYKGGDLKITFEPMDGFGAYRLFMFNIKQDIPDTWLVARIGTDEQTGLLSGGRIVVRANPA